MNWNEYWTWYWQALIALFGLYVVYRLVLSAVLSGKRDIEMQDLAMLEAWRADKDDTQDSVVFTSKDS